MTHLLANVLNVFDRTIKYSELTIQNNRIASINALSDNENPAASYILPGFVDAHVHIESSMLTPAQFARLAVVHGTVATVSDPHEIGNVLGVPGVEYMIADGQRVPFKFCFGAPSCVPATTFESAGATINVQDVRALLEKKEIGYLAEMMNFPGVLNRDPDVVAKIAIAQALNKPIDGHAPGLRGQIAKQYIDSGMSTDHECFSIEEATDKLKYGMNILIREGSAAKNFDALIALLAHYPAKIMFCSDDKHPDNLVEGHINLLVKRALARGHNLWDVLRAACLNPVLHYGLSVGLLREGDPADFIVVDDLQNFDVLQTYIDGQLVAERGTSHIANLRSAHVNAFGCSTQESGNFKIPQPSFSNAALHCIEALDGQLITNLLTVTPKIENGLVVADVANDILKIVVVNRYRNAPVAVAFVKNFGLKHGAIASSVGHDSHNILAVGCDDDSLARAINLVVGVRGGVSAVGSEGQENGTTEHLLALPIAGLMSDEDGYEVARQYTAIDLFAKQTLGSTLSSPFMTLSFMALLVIPTAKLSDLGLFNGQTFEFTPLLVSQR